MSLINKYIHFYIFNFSWRRDCPDLKSKLTEFADSSLIPGWLELKSGLSGFNVDHRVAGSQYNYRCSSGFELPDHSNPDQVLSCQGTRAVDTSAVSSCVGEEFYSDITIMDNPSLSL